MPTAAGGTAQQRPHARQQFVEIERLDQVIVGACIEPGDAIAHHIAGGERQHGHLVAAGAQIGQQLQAVAPRQAKVEQQQRVRRASIEGARASQSILDPVDGMAVFTQAFGHGGADHRIVFDQQQAHGGVSNEDVALARR
jgi:hypothetical protein